MTQISNSTLTPGKYKHYKGQYYQVFGVAQHSETLAPLVVYQPLYGEAALWVRPLSMFTENVQGSDGQPTPRFSLVTPTESPVPFTVATTDIN